MKPSKLMEMPFTDALKEYREREEKARQRRRRLGKEAAKRASRNRAKRAITKAIQRKRRGKGRDHRHG